LEHSGLLSPGLSYLPDICLVPGGAPEPLQYLFPRDSELLQEFDALARLICQGSCQEVQRFYLAVVKAGLKIFRKTECTFERRR